MVLMVTSSHARRKHSLSRHFFYQPLSWYKWKYKYKHKNRYKYNYKWYTRMFITVTSWCADDMLMSRWWCTAHSTSLKRTFKQVNLVIRILPWRHEVYLISNKVTGIFCNFGIDLNFQQYLWLGLGFWSRIFSNFGLWNLISLLLLFRLGFAFLHLCMQLHYLTVSHPTTLKREFSS